MADLWPEEPVFNRAEEAQLIGTLINRCDRIIRQLDGPPENYRPLYLPGDPAQPATVERASEWSQGFWRAIMRIPGWHLLIEDRDARFLLVPILAFAKNPEGEALFGHTREKLEDILKDSVDSIAEFILRIREYYREYATSHDRHDRSQRPGRNDPCPCGSGKKYKRCCRAT